MRIKRLLRRVWTPPFAGINRAGIQQSIFQVPVRVLMTAKVGLRSKVLPALLADEQFLLRPRLTRNPVVSIVHIPVILCHVGVDTPLSVRPESEDNRMKPANDNLLNVWSFPFALP